MLHKNSLQQSVVSCSVLRWDWLGGRNGCLVVSFVTLRLIVLALRWFQVHSAMAGTGSHSLVPDGEGECGMNNPNHSANPHRAHSRQLSVIGGRKWWLGLLSAPTSFWRAVLGQARRTELWRLSGCMGVFCLKRLGVQRRERIVAGKHSWVKTSRKDNVRTSKSAEPGEIVRNIWSFYDNSFMLVVAEEGTLLQKQQH